MEINEGDPSAAEGCFTSTMANSGLAWSTVTDCSANQSNEVQSEAALATPVHSYVPWILVDGVLLENTNLLLPTICKAYTGPKPPSCRVLLKAEKNNLCYDKK